MEINAESLQVIHNQSKHRFEIWIEDYLSEIDYELRDDTMIIYHTGVPSPLEGHGIAGRLNQVALDYAEENSLHVVPRCSYSAAYIRRHPQYQNLIKE